MSFAGLLRQLRAQAQLTQEELAEAAGVSQRSVSDLERGINRTARRDTAVLLAGALGLAGSAHAVFIAAARGRVPAVQVLVAMQGQVQGSSPAGPGGVHGFVPALTSFIGRAAAVREVAALLGEYRLVTVTGPGGAGKTRLAAEVARRVADRFADGAWLVELATVQDPEQVSSVVAAALRVREQPRMPAARALADALGGRQLLVVLDNCEHVIGAAAPLCAGMLSACDDVRVLATSREPLRVAGEARYRLAPLSLPDPDDTVQGTPAEAVTLFADRARRAGASTALVGQGRVAVAQLVRRLDGMPLAIELAAARVEALGVTGLLDRLDDQVGLLTAADRLAPSRHQSLAATAEWSYQLLDETGRRVFRQLSVFPGPFTLEAAQTVAGPDAGPAVLHLVDCSLLTPPRTGPDGRSRYVLLETLRTYGSRLLAAAGEQGHAETALTGHALRITRQAAAGLQTGTGELGAARCLDAEDATTRWALAWAMNRDRSAALQLAVALAPWWYLRGRSPGGYPLLLRAAGYGAPGSTAWCAVQYWLGRMAAQHGDLVSALGHFATACDAVSDRPPFRELVDCLCGRSVALANLNQFAEAGENGRRALAMARQLGYPAGEGLALAALSVTARFAGDLRSALELARQASQIRADPPGWIAQQNTGTLTSALILAGDLTAAERTCQAALARARDTGDMPYQASTLRSMVSLHLQAGRTEDAATYLRELLQVAAPAGVRLEVHNGLEICGYLCVATGHHAEALTIWAAYEILARQDGYAEHPDTRRRDEPLRTARQVLGEATAWAAEERGAAMSLTAAVEYALLLTTPAGQRAEPAQLTRLSTRERELITLVAQGCTNAQIAARLSISIRTVSSHLDRIRDKTGCRRRADLTRLAVTTGLV